jgi:hypothetical protein
MSRKDTVGGNLPAHTGNDSKGSDVCDAAPDSPRQAMSVRWDLLERVHW